jgi:hypothetical protein
MTRTGKYIATLTVFLLGMILMTVGTTSEAGAPGMGAYGSETPGYNGE